MEMPIDVGQQPGLKFFFDDSENLDDLQAASAKLVAQTNADRKANGNLSALTIDPALSLAARKHSVEMRDQGYLDHISETPGFETPLRRYQRALEVLKIPQPQRYKVGENVYQLDSFYNYTDEQIALKAAAALLKSHEHRENILNPGFQRIGVGVAKKVIIHSSGEKQYRWKITVNFLQEK